MRYDDWHIEIHSEYGHPPKTEAFWCEGRVWTPGSDNTTTAERVAIECAEEFTRLADLLDYRENPRPMVWRLAVRPTALPDEPPVRVMVRVEAIIRTESIGKFSERDWCRE